MEASLLDKYFARISYRGTREPSVDVLHALTCAHTQHIPFENLDVLLGRGVDLADDAVFEKLVVQRRGGYCFEQNALFLRVLCALGFDARPMSARGRIFWPDRSFIPPRTHLFVKVELDGATWITDVGVGAASLTAAVRFELDLVQETPHDKRRIIRDEGKHFHQVLYGDTWTDVYEFTGEEMPVIDRVLANWYTSAHPQSHFKDRMMVARAADNGQRLSIVDGVLKRRDQSGHAHEQPLETPELLLATLAKQFGIHLPAGTRFPWPA